MGQRTRSWFEDGRRSTRFAQDPSGPQPLRVAIDHVLITGSAVGLHGTTSQLTATAYDVRGDVVSGVSVSWRSSFTNVVTVSTAGLLTFAGAGFSTITATVDGRDYTVSASTSPTTPTELMAAFNAAGPAQMLALFVENVNQTINAGLCTSWDDAVHPGQGKHLRPSAEFPTGGAVTSTLGGTNALAGQLELPASTGLTGGALFHADPFTSADVIPGSSGLYKVFSDYTAGLTVGGIAKTVVGSHNICVIGEDAGSDTVTITGDDTGNIQALHVTTQFTKFGNASTGSDPMHWSSTVIQDSVSVGNGDAGGQNFIVNRYCRDIMQVQRPGPTSGVFTNLLNGTRRLRLNPGAADAARHHRVFYVVGGYANAIQTKILCDWADTRWGDTFNDTNYLGIMFGNSYQEIAIGPGSPDLLKIVEGDAGAPAIPGLGGQTLGTTVNNFFGQRPQHLLFPFYHFLRGCDFSKRPATASVLISASEYINATGVTAGTAAVDQNFYWLDQIRALDPARVRVAKHDLVFCCSMPFDQQSANVPLLTDYIAAHAIPGGHAEQVVTFRDSVMWSTDAYWYGEGDVNRGLPGIGISPRLPWAGIHPNSVAFPLWRARYRAMWELLRGVDLTNRTIEVYASSPHVDLVGIGATTTPTWTPKNRVGATLGGKTLSFTSSDPTIASVNASTGQITAATNGQTFITAVSNDGGYGGCIAVVTGAVLDEIAYLRANFSGGDSAIPGYYSTQYGVTLGGSGFEPNGVVQWDDARGGGFGPSLTQALDAGQRPEWDSTNKVMQFDGAGDFIGSAASALFDLSGAKSLVIVGTFYQNSGVASGVAITGGSFARLIEPRTSAGAGGTIRVDNPSVEADSTVAVGTTRRLVIVSKNATTGIAIDVPTHVRVSTTDASQGAGNNVLNVGAQSSGSIPAHIDIRAILVIGRQVDSTDISVLSTWATTYHGATLV